MTNRDTGVPNKRHSGTVLAIALLAALGMGGALVYGGAYNIAADSPHTAFVLAFLDYVRTRSIVVRAAAIPVPADLADPKRIAAGAGLYAEMCSGCHLGPGVEPTEISQGLYPKAPQFQGAIALSPRQEFWVIKHGIKMTGMAAWGKTHSDELIWDMVAFLQKMPTLSAAQYTHAIKSAPQDHDEMMKDMKMEDAR